jgi:hypothetical protein
MFVCLFVCLMVLNATFNNISVISWRSVLLVEETGGPKENHWPVASHWQTLSHNVVHLALIEIQTQWWQTMIAWIVVNPTTIRSQPHQPLTGIGNHSFDLLIEHYWYGNILYLWKSIRQANIATVILWQMDFHKSTYKISSYHH